MKYSPKDGFPYYYGLTGTTACRSLFASNTTFRLLDSIEEQQAGYRYAPDKWSIKEVVGHLTDHERIKMFRAFLLSRNQPVALWGYDQNSLVANSRFQEMSFQQLLTDFKAIRKASLSFITGLSGHQLKIKGSAQHYEITLEEFLKSIIGHEIHHINCLKARYLQ